MPRGAFDPVDLPNWWGILELGATGGLRCARAAMLVRDPAGPYDQIQRITAAGACRPASANDSTAAAAAESA